MEPSKASYSAGETPGILDVQAPPHVICAEGHIEGMGVCVRVIAAGEEGTVWKGVLFSDR
jgi:hypothetical protein